MSVVLINHLMLLLAWTIFAVIHHVMANRKFKDHCRKLLSDKFQYYRLFYSVIATITLVAVLSLQISLESITINIPRGVAMSLAIPIGITGVYVMAICLSKYFFKLSGVEVLYNRSASATLETTGIHKHIRHPLYLGTLLFAWSLFLCFPMLSNLIACVCVTTYTLIGIKSEEQKLIDIFGEDYKQYQQTTPMLIPKFGKLSL